MDLYCYSCKQTLPENKFSKSAINGRGRQYNCKACVKKNNQLAKEAASTVENKARNTYLKNTYGITESDYNNMLKVQGDMCFICCMPHKHKGNVLAVDYHHVTGKVRGLLCAQCNTALGSFKAYQFGPILLERAIKYLLRKSPYEPK